MYIQKYMALVFLSVFYCLSHAAEPDLKNNDAKNTLSSTSISEKTLLPSSLIKLGEGQMNILFFKVYKAEFYSSKAPYNKSNYPKALKLTYQRDINKQEFIDATNGEWEKLRSKQNKKSTLLLQEEKWLTQLNDIFPDIKKGDVILFTLNGSQQANFYLSKNQTSISTNPAYEHLGVIKEASFGEHFLSIWLSTHTSRPKLRKQLLAL